MTSFWFVLALAVLFVMFAAATLLSRAGQLARPLRALRGRAVDVRVWGSSLPGGGESFRLESVRPFGAGLLLWLRPMDGGSRTLLKVAQPGAAHHHERGLEILEAAYVQWDGRRVPRVEGTPAVMLVAARRLAASDDLTI